MTVDPRFITAIDLSPYFVDKDSGEPLANGIVSFWEDDSRTTPKLVYSYNSANTPAYTALPNPITLSNTGTFQDSSGNNIAVFYFPYDSQLPNANVQLYYITVTNSMGTEQFTREAWPNIVTNESQSITQANISNEITNPQFADVLFNPTNELTITTTGAGILNVAIAPGWVLNITSSGTGSVAITRNSITGTTALPYNPPYTLTVTPGANITNLTLSQRIYHNPSIWSPQSGGTNGYLATSILLAPSNSLTMQYAPSNGGAPFTILTANNTLGTYQEITNTTQLPTANNANNSNIGYVDIIITLPPSTPTTFSNVQVVSLETSEINIVYEQTPVNRQFDYMFHYYNPLLQYKPIPSYLIGWDFPLNPAQFLGSTVAAQAVGANKSFYAWDQTIVFQTITSGVMVSRGANGEFVLTAATTGVQPAIIQYLDKPAVNEILNSRISSAIESKTSNTTGITGTISLWYCTDASLPSVAAGTNNSMVATLDANGHPETYNGTWVEVPRSNLGNAQFTVTTNDTTNFNLNGFNGWDMQGTSATQSANFFAIVVGFGAMTSGDTISINSVNVVSGDIPTRPAPQTAEITITACQYYYEKSFNNAIVPAYAVGAGNGEESAQMIINSPCAVEMMIRYTSPKRTVPTVLTYNPINNNAQATTPTTGGGYTDCINTGIRYGSQRRMTIYTESQAQLATHEVICNWTADARLGIV